METRVPLLKDEARRHGFITDWKLVRQTINSFMIIESNVVEKNSTGCVEEDCEDYQQVMDDSIVDWEDDVIGIHGSENLLQADCGKGGMMAENTWSILIQGGNTEWKDCRCYENIKDWIQVKTLKVEEEASGFIVGIEEATKVTHIDGVDSDTRIGVTRDVKVEDIEIKDNMDFGLMDSRGKIQCMKTSVGDPKDTDDKTEGERIFQVQEGSIQPTRDYKVY
ncbi:hypothetical protein R1flu_011900 [Riccia fluitans]|uniref:Uncharacterized protein n=1 Tax=Riccia fluitans TaxID=41844 RepID=A0ABD1ZA81_9MARC